MSTALPPVGTAALLWDLDPHIPDEFINSFSSPKRGMGRRLQFSPAQLWRVHLLCLLTRTFSFNGIVRLLPEQRAWRRFARLPNERSVPDVRMLHEFRSRFGTRGFRQVNDYLVRQVLKAASLAEKTVALMDATDLRASTADTKKKPRPSAGLPGEPRWVRALSSRATRAFMWDIKSTPCASGSAAIRPR
jgi:hypothetical protein